MIRDYLDLICQDLTPGKALQRFPLVSRPVGVAMRRIATTQALTTYNHLFLSFFLLQSREHDSALILQYIKKIYEIRKCLRLLHEPFFSSRGAVYDGALREGRSTYAGGPSKIRPHGLAAWAAAGGG